MQHLAAFVLKLSTIMILAEHLVKEVSIIEVILLINRRRIVFDNLFVVILQQLMPTLHDTWISVDVWLQKLLWVYTLQRSLSFIHLWKSASLKQAAALPGRQLFVAKRFQIIYVSLWSCRPDGYWGNLCLLSR